MTIAAPRTVLQMLSVALFGQLRKHDADPTNARMMPARAPVVPPQR